MMKRNIAVWLALCLLLCACVVPVQAQEAAEDAFSPGMAALERAVNAQGIEIQAQFAPEALMTVSKDGLSVLKALFECSGVVYRAKGPAEYMALCLDGKPQMDFSLTRGDTALTLEGSALPFALAAQKENEAALYYALGMNAALAQILAQSGAADEDTALPVPEQSGALTLSRESIRTIGERLGIAGMAVTEPVELRWTVEDGLLQEASLAGAVALGTDTEPYVLAASMRRNGGKVTCRVEATRDKRNTLTLSITASDTSKAATRTKRAQRTQDVRVELSGKLNGYTRKLNVTWKANNAWAVAEETGALEEKITHTLKIGYTDKSPEMANINLSDVSVTLKDEIDVQSGDDVHAAMQGGVKVALRGSTVIDGRFTLKARTLEEGEPAAMRQATPGEADNILTFERMDAQALQDAAQAIRDGMTEWMEAAYPLLPQSARETLKKGL